MTYNPNTARRFLAPAMALYLGSLAACSADADIETQTTYRETLLSDFIHDLQDSARDTKVDLEDADIIGDILGGESAARISIRSDSVPQFTNGHDTIQFKLICEDGNLAAYTDDFEVSRYVNRDSPHCGNFDNEDSAAEMIESQDITVRIPLYP